MIKQSENQIKTNELQILKTKNDLSLSIATAYLECLYNIEIVKVAENQLEISKNQKERVDVLIKNGQLQVKMHLNLLPNSE